MWWLSLRKFIACLLALMLCFPVGCQAKEKHSKPAKSRPVILVFTAKWCQACQEYKPTLQRLKREGYDVREIDVDTPTGRQAMEQYQITELPTTIIIKDAKIVSRQVGGMTRDQLLKTLKTVGCILFTVVRLAIIFI